MDDVFKEIESLIREACGGKLKYQMSVNGNGGKKTEVLIKVEDCDPNGADLSFRGKANTQAEALEIAVRRFRKALNLRREEPEIARYLKQAEATARSMQKDPESKLVFKVKKNYAIAQIWDLKDEYAGIKNPRQFFNPGENRVSSAKQLLAYIIWYKEKMENQQKWLQTSGSLDILKKRFGDFTFKFDCSTAILETQGKSFKIEGIDCSSAVQMLTSM